MLALNEKTEQFINFWAESRTVDRAGHMAEAYRSAIAELAAAKAETVGYLVPVKSGRSLVPAFDPDRLEEVSALLARIEQQKETIKTIERDISDFMEITDSPTISTLTNRVRMLTNMVEMAKNDARNVAQAQTVVHPDLLPTQVAALPDVIAAAERYEQVREETEVQIQDLKTRISQATRTFSKYIV